jgi:hypothetical protein
MLLCDSSKIIIEDLRSDAALRFLIAELGLGQFELGGLVLDPSLRVLLAGMFFGVLGVLVLVL